MIKDKNINKMHKILITVTLSLPYFLGKRSMVIAEDDTRTNDDRVDIDAEKTNRRKIIEKAVGMYWINKLGIRRSGLATPFSVGSSLKKR